MLASPIPKIHILQSLRYTQFQLHKITSRNHKKSVYGPSLTKLISSTVLSLADCKIFTYMHFSQKWGKNQPTATVHAVYNSTEKPQTWQHCYWKPFGNGFNH